MASQDTFNQADAEQQKAQYLEDEAQRTLSAAQKQAEGFRQQAQAHSNEASRLNQQAQEEVRQETERAA